MLRFLLSPRALVLHVGMVVAVVVMVGLAQWQWDRANTRVADRGAIAAVPFEELSAAGEPEVRPEAIGRAVDLVGRYEPDQRFVVIGQPIDGRTTSLDLAVLRLADGTKVPVVRGTIGDATAAPTSSLPTGEVMVTGRIQPSDDLIAGPDGVRSDPEAGVLSGIATSELVAVVGRPLHPGWVAAAAESRTTGAPMSVPQPLPDSALLIPDGGLRVQNLLYAIQWTVFAGFVLLVYRRFLMDAWDDRWQAGVIDVKETV